MGNQGVVETESGNRFLELWFEFKYPHKLVCLDIWSPLLIISWDVLEYLQDRT